MSEQHARRGAGLQRLWASRGGIIGLGLAAAVVFVACRGPNRRKFSIPAGFFNLYASNNGTSDKGDLDKFDAQLLIQKRFNSGGNEGIALDLLGNMHHNSDNGNSLIRVIRTIRNRNRPNNDTFNASNQDRDILIAAPQGGVTPTPKGIAIIHSGGFIIAADPANSRLVVFGTAVAGDAPAFASTTNMGGKAWDIAYDQASDRLFIARTDGAVAVYDNYAGGNQILGQNPFRPAALPDRVFFPKYDNFLKAPLPSRIGKVSEVNFHGVAYDAASDRLVVSDVGLAASATDGKLLVFEKASTLGGPGAGLEAAPASVLSGPNTLLGNPVDLILRGSTAIVAEKSNGRILVWEPIFGRSGDVAADRAIVEGSPEAVALEQNDGPEVADVSDLDNGGTINALMVISNPKNGASDTPPGAASPEGDLNRLSTDLVPATTQNLLDGLAGGTVARNLQNGSVDASGDGYFSFDLGSVTEATQITASGTRSFPFNPTTPATITASSGDFGADGYTVGMNLRITGTANNNGTFTVATVGATTLTLSTADALIVEGPVSSGAVINGGNNADGGILIVNRGLTSRANEGETPSFALTSTRDRILSGSNTGLVRPKGVEFVNNLGLIIIAENRGVFSNAASPVREPAILAFSSSVGGNATPLLRTVATGGGAPWDLDYDPINDRLFVATTNGQLVIYDTYKETGGVNGPDRVVLPSNAQGQPLRGTMNLHGCVYDAVQDAVFVSDVGSAADAGDGRIYVFLKASTASGNVKPDFIIEGNNTFLGNPVDLAYDGARLFVAEKSNKRVLRFDDILLKRVSGNVTPSAMTAVDAPSSPESLFLVPSFLGRAPR